MGNDGNVKLDREGAIFSPNEAGLDFLPEPSEHDMRKLTNTALNTEDFSPDKIVSAQDDISVSSAETAEIISTIPKEDENHIKGYEPDVVKNNTTDGVDGYRQVEEEIDKVMRGQKSPFDFADTVGKFRESYGDNVVEKVM